MSESVVIPFELKEVPQAIGRAMALAGAVDRVAIAVDKSDVALRKLNRTTSSSVAIFDRAANSAGRYAVAIMLAGAAANAAAPAIASASSAANGLQPVRISTSRAIAQTGAAPRASARLGPDPNKTAALPAWKRKIALATPDPVTPPPKVKPSKAPPRIQGPAGPASALARAQANMAFFGPLGGPAAFDAQIALQRAQANMARAQKGPQSPIMQAIMTSRFGVGGGGGAMPLVGRTLAALGPTGTAASAIVLAGAEVLKTALERGTQRISLAFESGSMGSANAATWAAAGLGADASQIGGFLGTIGDGGPAGYYARKAKINTYSSPYGAGNQDAAGSWVKFLKHYSDSSQSSEIEARMAGKATGMSSQIALARRASASTRALLFSNEEAKMDPKQQQATADATIRLNLANERAMIVIDRLGSQIVPPFADALERLEPAIKTAAAVITPLITGMADQAVMTVKLGRIINDVTTFRWDRLAEDIKALTEGTGGKSKQERAADKMENAANKMQNAADAMKEGTYGSGADRARASLPGMTPDYDKAAHRQAAASGSVVF